MPRIIVYVATSADGYIARPDGDVSWLDRPDAAGDYGLAEFYESIDTVVMGRKTYEFGLKHGQAGYPGKENYVLSRTHEPGETASVTFANVVNELAERLRAGEGKNIWLVGGAGLIGAFLDAGQIDELIVHVIPVLIGQGIPLLEAGRRSVPLSLLSTHEYPDGVVRLHYAVFR